MLAGPGLPNLTSLALTAPPGGRGRRSSGSDSSDGIASLKALNSERGGLLHVLFALPHAQLPKLTCVWPSGSWARLLGFVCWGASLRLQPTRPPRRQRPWLG